MLLFTEREEQKRWNDGSTNNYWALIMCFASKEEKEFISVLNVTTVQCAMCEERCVSGTKEEQRKEKRTCLRGEWWEMCS